MSARMTWQRTSDYSIRCEPWTICAIYSGDDCTFELWHDKRPDAVGRFKSPGMAKAEAERLEAGGEA